MTAWPSLAPVVCAAVAVIVLPGLAVGAALRLRGILLWGFAPAAGVASISIGATVIGFLGVTWSHWTASIVVVVLIAAALVIGRILGPERFSTLDLRPGWVVCIAILAGALLGAIRIAVMIGSPGNLSQTNDAIFHLNALRFVQESGSASSLDLFGTLERSGFYPAAWHAVTSLVIDVTGADLISAANAVSVVIAGPIWVISMTAFVWCATGGRRIAVIFAAVMAPSLAAFPFHMLDFGVLYPYALSLTMLPGVLAVLAEFLRGDLQACFVTAPRIWVTAITSLIGLTAIALAQPSVLLNWLIGATVMVLWAVLRGWRGAAGTGQRRRVLGAAAVLVLAAGMWVAMMRVSPGNLWGPRKPAAPAVVEMLLNDSVGPGPVVTTSVMALLGVLVALRRPRLRWLVLYGAAVSMLVIVAVSVQSPLLRNLLAPWYADPHRFIAMMPLVVIPLAAVGADGVVSWIRVHRRGAVLFRLTAAVLLLLVVTEVSIWTSVAGPARSYIQSSQSYLSSSERELLESLPDYVDAHDRILGNPSAGAAFGFALSGADVVPRTWAMPEDADFQRLRWELNDAAYDPAVCDALDRMGVGYVLDFGASAKGAGKWDMPGLTGFDHRPGFELVGQRGGASLWRVTACAR